MYRSDQFDTPLGPMTVVVNGDDALCFAGFDQDHPKAIKQLAGFTSGERLAAEEDAAGIRTRFERYFGGELDALNAVKVAAEGTPFQHAVWQKLRAIPTGSTASYGELATQLGKPGASRAVGAANGLNPIAIVVPCHRVIGSDGALTGYAGGVERKRWLLMHEGALPARLL